MKGKEMSKIISKHTYYAALGTFIVAVQKQRQADRFEADANKLLGADNGSHLSDAIYDYEIMGTVEEFDEVLRKMDIIIEDGK